MPQKITQSQYEELTEEEKQFYTETFEESGIYVFNEEDKSDFSGSSNEDGEGR